MSNYKPAKPFVWIQGESGEGYLCPVDSIENVESLTEEELRERCFGDSTRPWND